MRELIKLTHVRQLQKSSLGLSRGWQWSAGAWLDAGRNFLLAYTVFRDCEALALDSEYLIQILPTYLPCIIDLLGADLRRSELTSLGSTLGVLWEPQETHRNLQGNLLGNLSGNLPGNLPGILPGSIPGSLPGNLPRSLPGNLPGSLPGNLPGRLPANHTYISISFGSVNSR